MFTYMVLKAGHPSGSDLIELPGYFRRGNQTFPVLISVYTNLEEF